MAASPLSQFDEEARGRLERLHRHDQESRWTVTAVP
jgi:hypothetical protein